MSLLETRLENEKPWWELEKREFIPVYGFVFFAGKTINQLDLVMKESSKNTDLASLCGYTKELLFHRWPRAFLLSSYNCAIAGLVAIAVDYISK